MLAGAVVRTLGLGRQILADDEFHAYRAALRDDLSALYLFTHNALPEDPLSDYGSAIALWARLLADTVGIDEWGLRAPMWLAGVVLPLVVGFTGARVLGRRVGVIAAWLTALSPLLVLYSRFARPYEIVALCGALLLLAADRFRCRPTRSGALLFGAVAAFGVWVNATLVPTALALAAVGFAPALGGRAGGGARRDALAGLGLGLLLAGLLVGPELPAVVAFASAKAAAPAPPLAAWWAALQVLAGVRSPALVLLFAALAFWGAAAAWREARVFALLALAAAGAQLAAFVLLRPHVVGQPLVIARYAMAALPALLLLVATGLAAVAERATRGLARQPTPAQASALLAAAVIALWFARGPLPDLLLSESAYTSRPDRLAPRLYTIDPAAVPAFYRQLDEELSIVEVPWVLEWPLAIADDYQQIHGARVRALSAFWPFQHPGSRLRSSVGWRGGEPRLAGVDLVVVHLDLVEEWKRLTGAPVALDPDRLHEAARRYRTDAAAIDAWLARSADWHLVHEEPGLRVYGRATAQGE